MLLHTIRDISSHAGGFSLAAVRLSKGISELTGVGSVKLAASPGISPLWHGVSGRSNCEWIQLPESSIDRLGVLSGAIRRQVFPSKPCLIHDHGLWLPNNHVVAVETRRLGIPRIVSPHGMLEPWALQHKAWKKKLAWFLFQRRDLETAQVLHATAMSEALQLKELCPQVPIVVIPLGVDLPESKEAEIPSSGGFQVLFLSRIHPKKGLLNLIKAWKILELRHWNLAIAGSSDDGYRGVIEKKVEELELTGTVRFVGSVEGEEKWQLYKESDLFVLPTFSENFGFVVVEALACGIPTITTKGAPWSDLITHQCGWWIDIGISPLVEAMKEATSLSQARRREMGSRGRMLVASKYTWDRATEQMLDVYEWMLGRERKPVSLLD
jgi:glycosyltransferase involved in cell wall biosynthesis